MKVGRQVVANHYNGRVKILLNTSFTPYGCWVFDDGAQILGDTWTDNKETNERVLSILQQIPKSAVVEWVAGVTGPGGFSSLRIASCIINGLQLTRGCAIKSVRADVFLRHYLYQQKMNNPFVLNSFGQQLFWCEEEDMELIDTTEAQGKSKNQPIITSFLPAEKAELFPDGVTTDVKNIPEVLHKYCEKLEPVNVFTPYYAFPAVKKQTA